MGRRHPEAVKAAVLAAVDSGMSAIAAAAAHSVEAHYVYRLLRARDPALSSPLRARTPAERRAIITDRELSGEPAAVVAARHGVGRAYVHECVQAQRQHGEQPAPRPRRTAPRKLTEAQETALAARIASEPMVTVEQLRTWLLECHAVQISQPGMLGVLKRNGVRTAGQRRRG